MESACPKCKKKMEHEDYLFEVVCSDCGMRFNPFYDKFSEGAEAGSEPGPEATNFQESATAFQEIVNFGEALGTEVEAEDAPQSLDSNGLLPEPGSELAATSTPPPRKFTSSQNDFVASGEDSVLMTSGDTLHGYRVTTYFPPQSVWADSDSASDNPLDSGFHLLWEKCSTKGANGIVAVQWRFTPDGSRILISGTPVRCEKE